MVSIDFDRYQNIQPDWPIGVFDSGIGGLTVLEAILGCDQHQNATSQPGSDGVPDFAAERFIYLGDQANMPYGNYPDQGKEGFLRELILKDAIFLLGNRFWPDPQARQPALTKPPIKALVVACNTATAYGIEDLRAAARKWQIPIITVGVVEAGATAVLDHFKLHGQDGAVAVLATMGTCNSGAYPRTIRQTAGRRGMLSPMVVQQGSLGLAGAIEGDPAFVPSSTDLDRPVPYRGPSIDRAEAPIDPALIEVYGFETKLLAPSVSSLKSMRLNSIEDYVRYEVATLVENYRQGEPKPTQPIRVVLLGCTHFPFESDRIVRAFRRLRDYRDARGHQPYASLISGDIQLVDPAQLTAKELYRQLALGRLLHRRSDGAKASGDHRLFISVPNQDVVGREHVEQGWFTYSYKYGRPTGDFQTEHVKVVPINKELLPASSIGLLKTYAPLVSRLVGLE